LEARAEARRAGTDDDDVVLRVGDFRLLFADELRAVRALVDRRLDERRADHLADEEQTLDLLRLVVLVDLGTLDGALERRRRDPDRAGRTALLADRATFLRDARLGMYDHRLPVVVAGEHLLRTRAVAAAARDAGLHVDLREVHDLAGRRGGLLAATRGRRGGRRRRRHV